MVKPTKKLMKKVQKIIIIVMSIYCFAILVAKPLILICLVWKSK